MAFRMTMFATHVSLESLDSRSMSACSELTDLIYIGMGLTRLRFTYPHEAADLQRTCIECPSSFWFSLVVERAWGFRF